MMVNEPTKTWKKLWGSGQQQKLQSLKFRDEVKKLHHGNGQETVL